MTELTEQELEMILTEFASDFEIEAIRDRLQANDYDEADVIIEMIIKRIE